MPKLDLFDLETFINLPTIFASPLDIPHQIEQNSFSVLNAATPPPPNLLQETFSGMRRGQAESSGVFYGPKEPKLKLEMEIFGDLSAYWPPTKAMAAAKPFQNAVDELNTPVFEKAPFDYDRPSHSSGLLDVITSTEDPFNFKIKTELSSFDNVNIEDNLMIKEDTIAFNEGDSKDISSMMPIEINTDMGRSVNNYIVFSSQGINTNSSNVFTPNNSEYEDIYHNPSDKVTPMYKDIIEDDVNLAAVNPCDIFLNNNSNDYGINISNENSNTQFSDPSQQYIILQTAPFETPDNSRSASEYSDIASPTLKLHVDQKFKSVDTIDTPDVIDTIDAIENEKSFNILNFITDEDIHTAAPALSTINLPAISSTIIPQQTVANTQAVSRIKLAPKRRHRREDDDDDYVPPVPVKKRIVGRKIVEPACFDSDSDSSDDEELQHKPPRRGRPPKRNVSISSEDCPDGKYREMRDKNNEASRKSRLKRKMKEIAQEGEADILEEKNTKLKAQVEQLEKTVNNFRNNLMQILLKK